MCASENTLFLDIQVKEQKVLSEYCGENRQMVFNTHQNQITKGSNRTNALFLKLCVAD